MPYWLQFWWVFPIALLICIAVCVVGICGAVMFVPFFTLAFPALGIPLTPAQAVQVGLFTEIFGFASSTTAFWRYRLIDFSLARFALLFAVPLAVAGGILANVLSADIVLAAMSGVMLIFAYLLYRVPSEGESGPQGNAERQETARTEDGSDQREVEHRDRQGRVYRYQRRNDGLRAVAMAFGGLFEGLVGFSIGEIGVVEQVLRGMPIRVAIGTNHLIIAGTATAAAVTHLTVVLQRGEAIRWNLLAMTVPAVLIGGQFAGWLAGRISQEALRRFLAVFLIVLALLTGVRTAARIRLPVTGWILVVVALAVTGLVALFLWRRRELKAKFCYASAAYYCCSPSDPACCENER